MGQRGFELCFVARSVVERGGAQGPLVQTPRRTARLNSPIDSHKTPAQVVAMCCARTSPTALDSGEFANLGVDSFCEDVELSEALLGHTLNSEEHGKLAKQMLSAHVGGP